MEIKSNQHGLIVVTEDGRYLRKYWSGASQTGINKTAITKDFEKATLFESRKEAEICIAWYKDDHVKSPEFQIKNAQVDTSKILSIV